MRPARRSRTAVPPLPPAAKRSATNQRESVLYGSYRITIPNSAAANVLRPLSQWPAPTPARSARNPVGKNAHRQCVKVRAIIVEDGAIVGREQIRRPAGAVG